MSSTNPIGAIEALQTQAAGLAQQDLSSDAEGRSEAAIRPLSRRYLAVLAAVAALALLDQAMLQPLLLQLNFSAPAINLAGRQRMLSQKVSKSALALELAADGPARPARRRELVDALAQWTAAHQALLHGDAARGVQPADEEVAAALREVEPVLTAIAAAAGDISADAPSLPRSHSAAAARILQLEPVYLQGMEQAVAMLEAAASRRVAWLRACGLTAMLTILLLLLGVNVFVLRPATRLIRAHLVQLAASDARHRHLAEMLSQARDTLELRVAERTSELSAANAALQREMAERQAAELRMRALSADLAHASRVTALGQLAAGLAHEINQPLAAVTNYAGTLDLALDRADPENGRALQLAGQIKQAALRAGEIVRRMRNFVRRGEVQAAPVDLNVLVDEVMALCRPELRDAQVQLTLELAPQPALVHADAVQIQQVLVNLAHNAVQAMEQCPASRRKLWLSVRQESDDVIVSVRDSGPGFPTETSEHGFQPFYSSKREGLGLGLAISRTIVEQHQGRLVRENSRHGGAIVAFRLPRLRTHDTLAEQHAHCVCS